MSAKTQKRQKQLKAFAKKRARRPVAAFEKPRSLTVKHTVEKRMIRDHADVLQNVEWSLVNAANESDEIDDSIIEQTLRHAIQGKSSEDSRVASAMDVLVAIRQQRSDVSDNLWSDALRVIYTSLQRHSSCKPGDRGYLNFVSQYIR